MACNSLSLQRGSFPARVVSKFSAPTLIVLIGCLLMGAAEQVLSQGYAADDPITTQQGQRSSERERLWRQALKAQDQGNTDQAVALGRRLLALDRQSAGEGQEQVANTLAWLFTQIKLSGDLTEPREIARELLAIQRNQHGDESWQTRTAKVRLDYIDKLRQATADAVARLVDVENKANEAHRAGNDEDVLKWCESLANEEAKVIGENHPYYANTLRQMADCHWNLNNRQQALKLYQRELDIRRNALGNHPEVASTWLRLARRYRELGDGDKSAQHYRQAADIFGKVYGPQDLSRAFVLHDLGMLQLNRGNYAESQSFLRQAIDVYEKSGNVKQAYYANAWFGLTAVYLRIGELNNALASAQNHAKVSRRVFGEDDPRYASSLAALADVYTRLYDSNKAEPLIRQALEIRKNALGEDHLDYADSLSQLASLEMTFRKYDEAQSHLEETISIQRRKRGERNQDYAISLVDLAKVHIARGYSKDVVPRDEDVERAVPLYEQAIEIHRTMCGLNCPQLADALYELADLQQAMGRFKKAQTLYDQASGVFKNAYGEASLRYAVSQSSLSELYQRQGDFTAAHSCAKTALSTVLQNFESQSTAQSDRQQLAMLRVWRNVLLGYLSTSRVAEVNQDEIYNAVLTWKGAFLARQRAIREAASQPELKPILTGLQQVTSRLASLAFAEPDGDEQQKMWRTQLNELSDQKEALERQLAEKRSPRPAADAVSLESLRRSLPEGCVLIDFVDALRHLPETRTRKFGGTTLGWVAYRQLAVFIIDNKNPVRRVNVDASYLGQQIDAWLKGYGSTSSSMQAGRKLRTMIWEPLEPYVENAKVILVSPDSALGRFPLAALPGKTEGTFLLEEMPIALVPAPQLIPHLLQSKVESASDTSLLLLGNVDYDAASSGGGATRAEARIQFRPLAGTESEAEKIATLFRQQFATGKLTQISKDRADEAAVRREAPRHRLLHLATHGFFAPEVIRSALSRDAHRLISHAATSMEIHSELMTDQSIGRYYPLLMSGLAFAGSNHRNGSGDDGILYSEEVAALDLSGVELAVLSACETGQGEVADGEGLLGLLRTFQAAGSRSVVASLWKVNDGATQQLMIRFYENLWQKKMSKLEALRDAQLWMLREAGKLHPDGTRGLAEQDPDQPPSDGGRLPPYYWAAFVLSGDWR